MLSELREKSHSNTGKTGLQKCPTLKIQKVSKYMVGLAALQVPHRKFGTQKWACGIYGPEKRQEPGKLFSSS